MDSCENQPKNYHHLAPIRPTVNNTPSIFTIEHILNKAGSMRQTNSNFADTMNNTTEVISARRNSQNQSESDQNSPVNCHLEHLKVLPPILNWLQYTRYKPPRLPSKYPCCYMKNNKKTINL